MKVGFISDIHVGEYSNIPEIISEVAIKNGVELLIIAGDLCGHYKEVEHIIKRIVSGTKVDLRFIPGNHDLYRQGGRSSKEAYDTLLKSPYNLISNPIIGEGYAIIGDTGWYDYSYNPNDYTYEKLKEKKYGGMKWLDKSLFNWDGLEDPDVSSYFLLKLKDQISKFKGKELTVVTHIVPFEHFIICKEDPNWDYFSSFVCSKEYGELYVKEGVKMAVFGHTHTRFNETFNGIECICRPLGNKYELEKKDLFKEISDTLFIKEY